MHHLGVFEDVIGALDDARQAGVRGQVVGAVRDEDVARRGEGFEETADVAQRTAQNIGVLRQRGKHPVAIRKVDGEHFGAVGCGPAELRRRGLGANAPPDEDGVDAEAAQDRRQVRDVP